MENYTKFLIAIFVIECFLFAGMGYLFANEMSNTPIPLDLTPTQSTDPIYAPVKATEQAALTGAPMGMYTDSFGDSICHYTWGTDLKLGASSSDVHMLQQVLNLDPATQIAASGPGAPGHETMYFGSLTLEAVKRFQEKYGMQVLFGIGIYAPTGYVGSATRAMLNALCE